jgi:glutaredoxin
MSKVQVILYTRPGCHLCEEAKRAIEQAGCGDVCALSEINIESSEQLLDEYRNEIPVVLIDGVEAFRHRLTAEEFRTAVFKIRTRTAVSK